MSKNVYDIFRTVSKKRTACFDTRSAAFITQGKLSKDIYHKRKQKTIKAGLVYQYKEGPDEAIVYTFKKDDLRKGDYFIYDHVNYLVYEDQKLTDENNNHKKHRALECNVSFKIDEDSYKAYFLSSLRRKQMPDFEGKELLMPDEMPLLVLPTNSKITINTRFKINSKYWEVKEFDDISNPGITYYYIERYVQEISKEEEILPVFDFVIEETNVNQSEVSSVDLRPMVEYIFVTEDFVFASNPKVDIILREETRIGFKVPFGIEQVTIETKEDGNIVEKVYSVVLE